jgi:ClpP class serine protease
VKSVARNRGKSVEEVRNGFGEGRVVSARQAVKLGMADRIGTLEETIGQLQRRLYRLSPEEKQQAEALRAKVSQIMKGQKDD